MAECNCGCGRKIGFGGRGMNKNIRRTDDLVTELRDGRDGFAGVVAGADAETVATADAEPRELLDQLDDLIHEGESYRDFWVEATHGDYPRDPSAALAMKRDWNAWTRSAPALDVLVGRRRKLEGW